jgi:lysozyme
MTEIKSMDAAGIEFLIQEEGIKLKPYLDSAGIPTIGVGCTYYEDGTRVTMNDPAITRERAISLYKNILKPFETTVWSVTRDDINQHQFNALTSLSFNIGTSGFKGSTVLKLVNKNPKDPAIGKAFEMWKNAGGKPVLLGRRKREVKLYFT